eukprot:TRINITY_DN918_c0_g1_i1.p1 TRINITY_DN918_c0_g1~~TRINITY_DN918_c0_g1_i1.p1  ORF type:complete len:167 (-),score=43.43 TRINITY_DN918_c0_g1_i1:80-580(-)
MSFFSKIFKKRTGKTAVDSDPEPAIESEKKDTRSDESEGNVVGLSVENVDVSSERTKAVAHVPSGIKAPPPALDRPESPPPIMCAPPPLMCAPPRPPSPSLERTPEIPLSQALPPVMCARKPPPSMVPDLQRRKKSVDRSGFNVGEADTLNDRYPAAGEDFYRLEQ